MKPQHPLQNDDFGNLIEDAEEVEEASEDDLWFLPGPMEEERDYLPLSPRPEPRDRSS